MPDIRIRREHQLGLARARKVAWKWAEEVEQKFDMECSVLEGEFSDTVSFTRSGVSGELIVAGDHFDLHARLGLLLGAFTRTIEREVLENLDTLLAKSEKAAEAAPAAKPAGKPATKRPRN